MASVRLADYRPAPWLLLRTDLTVQLHAEATLVEAQLAIEPNPIVSGEGQPPAPLILMGEELELLELSLDGQPLQSGQWRLEPGRLVLEQLPQQAFRLRSRVRIHPERNTALEGLYVSGGMVTSQCEAEGFRRITFHPDRPDLLSRFRVRIEAERRQFPVLLSNGNCLETGSLPSDPLDGSERHYAIWDDPFPKPSYLFALVAGRLEEARDSFITASGRRVQLRIHVEPDELAFTSHAMECLKRCMAWDEQVYGLEYDLDEFNIVAVRHFNMGAMENKSLNIFNSKLVLADSSTATDDELERIESVIAHEYFHNWTGNRITCRDWFQLSLKEGLTVFRDQQFSADQHGHALRRIENAALLRNTQFREDAGPTAHPIQPDHYQAIDNFYTTTIYEKGAEVIRALHTLIGADTYQHGMALYVKRHDGTAATCDDFLAAMREAAEASWAARGTDGRTAPPPFDFSEFRRWYHQAGTPVLRIRRRWDRRNGRLELQIRQHTPPTPGQPDKQPLVIPLALGLIGQAGEPLPLCSSSALTPLPRPWGEGSGLLILDQAEQRITLEGLPRQTTPPALSLLRHFSAPVKVELGRPSSELVHLLACDSDPFARWDAGQLLLRRAVLRRAAGRPDGALEDALVAAFERILSDPSLSEASRCALLSLPGLAELEEARPEPDPPALFEALQVLRRHFGRALAQPLGQALERCTPQWSLSWPEGNGDRMLTGLIWSWGVAAEAPAAIAAARAAVEGRSMTLARAGLRALQNHPIPAREEAMRAFHDRWQERPVILDAWFSLEASAPFAGGLARIDRLLRHPRFDPSAPNAVRAVLGGLAANPPVFHASDGSGYRYLAERIVDLDQRNSITAARLAKVFSRWQSYAPQRRQRMLEALRHMAASSLSTNSREVVEQCLAAGEPASSGG
ncbi:MAG: aminopeptidase N [Synechococcaceae cyanobacterium]|nr:aminopeptidase N [Synechococcaceae cyanobacterium]